MTVYHVFFDTFLALKEVWKTVIIIQGVHEVYISHYFSKYSLGDNVDDDVDGHMSYGYMDRKEVRTEIVCLVHDRCTQAPIIFKIFMRNGLKWNKVVAHNASGIECAISNTTPDLLSLGLHYCYTDTTKFIPQVCTTYALVQMKQQRR
jgi:hypothetical protein